MKKIVITQKTFDLIQTVNGERFRLKTDFDDVLGECVRAIFLEKDCDKLSPMASVIVDKIHEETENYFWSEEEK